MRVRARILKRTTTSGDGLCMRANSNNAGHQAGASNCTASQAASLLAAHIDDQGNIPVTVTIRLSPPELIMLARKARYEERTIDDIIEQFVADGPTGADGILEHLRDYEGEIPARGKHEAKEKHRN